MLFKGFAAAVLFVTSISVFAGSLVTLDVDAALRASECFKDDVKEVKNNFECGLSIKNFNEIEVGDMLEVFEVVEVARKL